MPLCSAISAGESGDSGSMADLGGDGVRYLSGLAPRSFLNEVEVISPVLKVKVRGGAGSWVREQQAQRR